jgi:hypothetical protein
MKPDDDVIRRCAEQLLKELAKHVPPEDADRVREAVVSILVAAVELHQRDCWKARRKLGPCQG